MPLKKFTGSTMPALKGGRRQPGWLAVWVLSLIKCHFGIIIINFHECFVSAKLLTPRSNISSTVSSLIVFFKW